MMGEQAAPRRAEDRPPLLLWVALLLTAAFRPLHFTVLELTHLQGVYLPHALTFVGRDFTNLYFGGDMVSRLPGFNVYDQTAYLHELNRVGIKAGQNYSYPPATLIVGAALATLPYPVALGAWALGGIACFVAAARPYIRFAWPWLLLLPMVAEFPYGQYGLFAAALWLWSFRGSGPAAGVLTLKPHLGLLLAPILAIQRRWRQAAIAAGTAILLWGLGEALFGLTRSYFAEGFQVQLQILLTPYDEPYFGGMPSTFIRLRHLALAWPAHIAVSLAALAMIWPLRHQPLQRLAFPLATSTFLILPYSFAYDMAAVGLGFLVIIDTQWGQMGWRDRAFAVAGYAASAIPSIAPPLLLMGLWVQRELLLSPTARAEIPPAPSA